MAKRFVDTDLFKKRFVKGLQAPYKLLWIYILNDCNHAGIYEVEIEVAALRIGCADITESDAIRFFEDKIIVFDSGTKWFIPSFIEFQYGQLSENNRAHTGIISILKKYNLIDQFLRIKPLTSPLQGDKDMDKEKEMDMEKEKEKGGEISKPIMDEKTSEVFEALKVHYQISEMKQFNLIRELDSFCMVLQSQNQIEYFIEQFPAYIQYKERAQEKPHNFKGFIGTVEKLYQDGGWCADNWKHKLLNIKQNGKQNNGLNHAELDELIAREAEKLRGNPSQKN